MKKDTDGFKLKTPITAVFIFILITAVFMLIFAGIMYIAQIGNEYSPVLATVSLAFGTFAAAFYQARKNGRKGMLIGAATGGTVFLIITLISFILDSGAVTYNTLFHFIIIMLAALIGGVMGVNKKENRKYI